MWLLQAEKNPQDLKSTGKLPHLPYSMFSYELNLKVFLLERLSVLITFVRKQLEELSSFSHQSLYRLFQPGVKKKKSLFLTKGTWLATLSCIFVFFPRDIHKYALEYMGQSITIVITSTSHGTA